VEDRGPEATLDRLIHPLRSEAVGAKRLVLDRERVALLLVVGEPKAACPAARVTGERGKPLERPLGHPPVPRGLPAADALDRDVVGSGAAAKREASVPAARPAGDLTGLVHADAPPRLGERECRRAASDPAADDRDVG
jgi:hypothetical protein